MLNRTRWALLALTVTATALNAVQTGPALADPGAPDLGRTSTVTLLTGDVVTVRSSGSGCPVISVKPVEPDAVFQQSCDIHGHMRVIPARVAAQVGTVLDSALFDVTALVADGYDDAATQELPVIVKPRANAKIATFGEVRSLPSIGAVAGRLPKKNGNAPAARSATDSLLAGAEKVWLDRRVHATQLSPAPAQTAPTQAATNGAVSNQATARLDRNLDQIGAPEAWREGYTGKGARVAVLDSGADFSHPDLAGRVADKADFITEGGDAADHFGHGTHVATTIAGSGAAAHGERKGVAPDASLIVGKVLDDTGSGTDSQIIAGMEWAASRADVVNMSLGGGDPTDGTDPLSLAVDALTKQTGALFVVSAGNSGGLITSPAAATTALTVGAVDGEDQVADFSSRGPLWKSHAAKPELVAPGVDVVAGRAAGTTLGDPIDQYYISLDGTSMAAPHVAGAAALLAQRHPDWQADRLKAALVGAADPLPGADPYTVGSGRLDAARALSGPVSDQPVVALGTFGYPQHGSGQAKLSWTGESTSATVNLDLDVTVTDNTGKPVARGAASLSDRRVRLRRGVPAGTTLRIDQAAFAGRPGVYTASVTATAHGGKFVAGTPVTFYVEPPSYDLTVNTSKLPEISPDASDWVNLLVTNLDDPRLYASYTFGDPGEPIDLRVPAGHYAVSAAYTAYDPITTTQAGTYVAEPDVAVTADHTMTMDNARSKPVTATVDGVATRTLASDFILMQTSRNGLTWSDFVHGMGERTNVSVAPMRPPGIGGMKTYTGFALESPAGTADPYHYDLVYESDNGVPGDPSHRVTKPEQKKLARIDERFNQMDSPGMVTSLIRLSLDSDGALLTQNQTWDLPVNRTDYVSPGFTWMEEGVYGGLAAQTPVRTYQEGSRQSDIWARQPLHSDWYDDPATTDLDCSGPSSRTSGNIHVDLVTLTDRHQRMDCLAGGSVGVNRKLSFYRNGELVDERAASRADYTVPREEADYRLTFDVETSRVLPFSTHVTTSWTFRSEGPGGTGSVPLPLLAVDYALPLDAANHPAGDTAEFAVRQANGVRPQRITSFQVWTSTDDGATWQLSRVRDDRDGYRAELPAIATGQAVSLRVKAAASGGSGIDQTIIRAYRAG